MRMTCGNDQFVVFVLDFDQLFCYSMGMVVVDESDSANDRSVWFPGLLIDQTVADQIPKGL